MDNSTVPIDCHRLGGRGFLTDGVDAHPAFYLNVWDLMEQGKYTEAQAEWDSVIPRPPSLLPRCNPGLPGARDEWQRHCPR